MNDYEFINVFRGSIKWTLLLQTYKTYSNLTLVSILLHVHPIPTHLCFCLFTVTPYVSLLMVIKYDTFANGKLNGMSVVVGIYVYYLHNVELLCCAPCECVSGWTGHTLVVMPFAPLPYNLHRLTPHRKATRRDARRMFEETLYELPNYVRTYLRVYTSRVRQLMCAGSFSRARARSPVFCLHFCTPLAGRGLIRHVVIVGGKLYEVKCPVCTFTGGVYMFAIKHNFTRFCHIEYAYIKLW